MVTEKEKQGTSFRLSQIQSAMVCGKEKRNEFAHFNYRSCEDILKAAKPLLLDGELLLLKDELVEMGGRIYIKATASFEVVGSTLIEVPGFAREPDSKTGMDASQITGCASSYARKYALNGLLLTDDGVDSDSLKPEKEEDKKATDATPGLTTIKEVSQIEDKYKEGHAKAGQPRTKYSVTDGNGTKYFTYIKKHATAAKEAKEGGLQVNIGFKVYGRDKYLEFVDVQSAGEEEGPEGQDFDDDGNPV